MQHYGKSAGSIEIQRLEFTIEFSADGQVSRNLGPTLRGGFGTCLRQVSCSLRRDTCSECFLNGSCAYGYLFETPIPESTAIMRKYPQAPHPFVFEPSDADLRTVAAGTRVTNSLVIIGTAADYLPYMFLAISELGQKGLGKDSVSFRLERVSLPSGRNLYDGETSHQLRAVELISLPVEPGESELGRFSLDFLTPTRLVVNGSLDRKPLLTDIVKALSRRVFLTRYFHCDGPAEQLSSRFLGAADEARAIDVRFSWAEATRYSTRQSRSVPLGGFVGRATYEGDVGVLRPLLKAGEYLHVGKNCTFGLGQFVLEERT